MSTFQYKTIANEHPQGKPKVYFTSHPDDFKRYFEEVTTTILNLQDCAIWYAPAEACAAADSSVPAAPAERTARTAEPAAPPAPDPDLALLLSQMQLFVVPVTTKIL
ncbi:MAG: hypothetical protein II642_00790, partial [Firmicutes bacterium]|nr:hypothetical protein [Bacillota bacterium]